MVFSTRANLALGTWLAFASVLPNCAAFAQTVANSDPISLGDLFTAEDSVALTPDATAILQDAAAQGQTAGNCPKGTITIVVAASDDPLFQEGLVRARLEIVEQALGDQAGDFRLETIHDGFADEVKVEYGRSDQEPPRLEVVWTPPPGSEVAPGDTITALITAYDDTDTFQTGISNISMAAGSDAPFGHDYPQPPINCLAVAPEQQMEGFYVVPVPAPAQVNMRASAKDFAGNEIDLLAAFPTRREPCASGVYWVGWIHGTMNPHSDRTNVTADAVRLCEMDVDPVYWTHLPVGQNYTKLLIDAGSSITALHTDTDADDLCDISGGGTSLMAATVGEISSVLEAIGPDGTLQWSVPTYWLSASMAGEYMYNTICYYGTGTQTTRDFYSAGVNIGNDSYDPLNGHRPLEAGRLVGSYATPDGFATADWELTREGDGPLYPEVAP